MAESHRKLPESELKAVSTLEINAAAHVRRVAFRRRRISAAGASQSRPCRISSRPWKIPTTSTRSYRWRFSCPRWIWVSGCSRRERPKVRTFRYVVNVPTHRFSGRSQLRQILGPTCFDDDDDEYVGHFWGLIETRPFMRVLQAIVRLAFENKDFNKSA